MLKKLASNLLMALLLKLMGIQESSDTHEECFNMKNTMKTIKNPGRNSVNFETNKIKKRNRKSIISIFREN